MVNLNMSKYTIITLDEAPSTNSWALENISCLDDGAVVYTAKQTAGRGRYNRKWVCDESDNIYMSLVLKPKSADNYPFANLTQYLSVVVCRLLSSEFLLNARIKWPNDILVNGAKISGILAEAYTHNNKIEAVILGLGLNINMKQETLDKIDQKATSISAVTGKNYNSETVLKKLIDTFYESYDEFVSLGFSCIKDLYISKCDFLGKNILISENGEKKQYFAKAIDSDGLLIALNENNEECKIITGDLLC